MSNRVLDEAAGQGKFLLVRAFRSQNPVLVFLGFLNIKIDSQLAKSLGTELQKDKE